MKKLSTIASTLLLSVSVYSQEINIKNDWQLLGAVDNISISIFDNSCVDYIWTYDNSDSSEPWKLYIANGQSSDAALSYPSIDSINKGQGYWLKGNDNCNINAFESIIKGQTLYNVWFGTGEDENGDDLINVPVVEEVTSEVDGTLIVKGLLNGGTGTGNWKVEDDKLFGREKDEDYIQTEYTKYISGSLSDGCIETNWVNELYPDDYLDGSNKELYFTSKTIAINYANTLTQTIPGCPSNLSQYEITNYIQSDLVGSWNIVSVNSNAPTTYGLMTVQSDGSYEMDIGDGLETGVLNISETGVINDTSDTTEETNSWTMNIAKNQMILSWEDKSDNEKGTLTFTKKITN